jgi:hypothetical protein
MAMDHQGPRRITRRGVLLTAAAGAGSAVVATAAARGDAASAQSNNPLVGSWLCTYNRSTGEVLTGLLTFHENGTVVNSTSDHLAGGTSHGTWIDLGNGLYAYSVIRLSVDAAGNYAGTRAVDSDLTVDPSGNSWTSVSRTIFYDTSGTLVRMLTSTGTASRVAVVRRTEPRPQSIDSLYRSA